MYINLTLKSCSVKLSWGAVFQFQPPSPAPTPMGITAVVFNGPTLHAYMYIAGIVSFLGINHCEAYIESHPLFFRSVGQGTQVLTSRFRQAPQRLQEHLQSGAHYERNGTLQSIVLPKSEVKSTYPNRGRGIRWWHWLFTTRGLGWSRHIWLKF